MRYVWVDTHLHNLKQMLPHASAASHEPAGNDCLSQHEATTPLPLVHAAPPACAATACVITTARQFGFRGVWPSICQACSQGGSRTTVSNLWIYLIYQSNALASHLFISQDRTRVTPGESRNNSRIKWPFITIYGSKGSASHLFENQINGWQLS